MRINKNTKHSLALDEMISGILDHTVLKCLCLKLCMFNVLLNFYKTLKLIIHARRSIQTLTVMLQKSIRRKFKTSWRHKFEVTQFLKEVVARGMFATFAYGLLGTVKPMWNLAKFSWSNNLISTALQQ